MRGWFALTLMCLFAASCSERLGYSVVLWEIPECGLEDGEIVPVFFKSNITHTYAIGAGADGKTEAPLWKLSPPESRRAARKTAERLRAFRNVYAAVLLDGLPIRAEPANTARQVYRLKKDETVKALYRGEGAPVMIGAEEAAGEWLRVMTDGGTEGWCFSYNLRLFNTHERAQAPEEAAPEVDGTLEAILARTWLPDYYGAMLRDGEADLARVSPEYGFAADAEARTARIGAEGFALEAAFRDIERNSDGSYTFAGSPFTVTPHFDAAGAITFLSVSVKDERGVPTAYNFIALNTAAEQMIAAEEKRRAGLFAALQAAGPAFRSENYGEIWFASGGRFLWRGYGLLSPALIPAGAGEGGTVSFGYFLAKGLKGRYDGVMTFRFAGLPEREVNFFYALEDGGLRLEDTGGASPKDNRFAAPGGASVTAFFAAL